MSARARARRVAIMAVDPGGTTGVARGTFDLGLGSVRECIAGCDDLESFDVAGDEREQAMGLALEWKEWQFDRHVEGGIALSDVVLVFEDWTPRLPLKSGERVVFYPVRIPAMFEGLAWRCLPPDGVRWQLPSTAMTFATDARLRSWGLWFRGRVHQRDAARHVAAQLNSLLG
jgi:hypothetical protein